MTTNEARWYGVSTGNGNVGVSQTFADYYVKTDDPWTLARAAIIATFEGNSAWERAAIEADVDGDREYTIYAVIHEDPEFDPDDLPENDREDYLNGDYDDGPAEFILEVFPAEDEHHENRRDDVYRINYQSIEDACGASAVAKAKGE